MNDNKKLQQAIHHIIEKAAAVEISSNVPFGYSQLAALKNLHNYCINQVLKDAEVMKDPRKINYMASQEFKIALVALCLSQAMVNPARRNRETREFFIENINIYQTDEHTKMVDFGNIHPADVDASVYPEIIEDWMIYRDREGFGISSLIDEKTRLTGLNGFQRGGDPIYEFARFHRKYTEKERIKEEKSRDSAQEAFRNAVVQSLANEMTRQQLLAGKNPLEILDNLLNSAGKYQPSRQIRRELDPEVEQNVARLLEYDNSRSGRER